MADAAVEPMQARRESLPDDIVGGRSALSKAIDIRACIRDQQERKNLLATARKGEEMPTHARKTSARRSLTHTDAVLVCVGER